MDAAWGYEDVALAHVARELLIFCYSHNILDVILAAMNLKGQASAPIYGVVNITNRTRKRRVSIVEPSDSGRSPKGA